MVTDRQNLQLTLSDDLQHFSLDMKLRTPREETHARILEKADELFRRYGFSKTTVGDIAEELQMSPANVYKFFPSKDAIIEKTAEKNLAQLQGEIHKAMQSKKSALARLEVFGMTVARFHHKICKNEKQMHKIVILAMEQDWKCIRDKNAFMEAAVTQILLEGMEQKEFRTLDAPAVAKILLASMTPFTHPVLVQEKIDHRDLERRVQETIRFLEHALQ